MIAELYGQLWVSDTWAPLHKTFAGVFTAKTQETQAIFFSIAICIKICQSFSMAKKSLAKSFMQRGPGKDTNLDTVVFVLLERLLLKVL